MSDLALAIQANEARARLDKYRRSLWLLCTEILGFDLLTEQFHKPILDRWDAMRRARRMGKGGGRDTFDAWPREHYKTFCQRGRCVQDFLYDPMTTVTWWHNVEEMAQESAVAVGNMLLKNAELRRLFPHGVLPSPMAKKFVTAGGFRLRCNDLYLGHAPSFRAWGQGSEATGGHSDIGYLDDIVARSTVEDSQMGQVRSWMRQTVRNVIKAGGWLNATGTRWDVDDVYADWLKSEDWDCYVRAALETDGTPDYKGSPVLMTKDQLAKKRRELELGGASDFAFQMMNDPSPAGEKAWDREKCEHHASLKELGIGKGDFKVVLSDPAPAKIGSFFDDRKRVDGEKNEWATCTVALRRNGQREEVILLDGAASKEWEPDQGWSEVCRQKRVWDTPYCSIEKTGQAVAFYTDTLARVSRTMGVRHSPIDLTLTYKGKNQYFARLAEKARNGEFIIADSCPEAFVEQFLAQCREWRALPGGRNNLKLDDRANCVSFATDPCFAGYARQMLAEVESPIAALFRENQDQHSYGRRYVQY
jgi:hypothetical protein